VTAHWPPPKPSGNAVPATHADQESAGARSRQFAFAPPRASSGRGAMSGRAAKDPPRSRECESSTIMPTVPEGDLRPLHLPRLLWGRRVWHQGPARLHQTPFPQQSRRCRRHAQGPGPARRPDAHARLPLRQVQGVALQLQAVAHVGRYQRAQGRGDGTGNPSYSSVTSSSAG
jgi:hypothetical protein